jgi:hypothetical protein
MYRAANKDVSSFEYLAIVVFSTAKTRYCGRHGACAHTSTYIYPEQISISLTSVSETSPTLTTMRNIYNIISK